MQESRGKESASGDPSSEGRTSPARQRGRWRWSTLLAPLLAILGTIFAFRQSPRLDPLDVPSALSLRWLWEPQERNGFARYPMVGGELRGVFALRGTSNLWAVGEGGLLLHSTDGGDTWTQRTLTAHRVSAPPRRPATTSSRTGVEASYASYSSTPSSRRQSGNPRQQLGILVIVPDLRGRTVPEAEKLLESIGLVLGQVQYSGGARSLLVATQRPAAGARVPRGDSVHVVLRSPPSPTNQAPATPRKGPDSLPGRDSVLAPRDSASGGGSSSFTDTTGYFPTLNDVCFVSPTKGWVVGDQGVIFATEDGGTTFQQATVSATSDLREVACAQPSHVITVGGRGIVLISRDGHQWQPAGSFFVDGRSSVAFSDSNSIVVTGGLSSRGEGSIYRSTDAGVTWTNYRAGIPASASGGSISFLDASTGFALSGEGVIVTHDAGQTWEVQKCPLAKALTEYGPDYGKVYAFSIAAGVAVDSKGVVWSTEDAWNNCSRVSAIGTEVTDLAAGTDGRLVVAGPELGLAVSSDGGQSWHSAIVRSRLTALYFADSARGWVAGPHGLLAYTPNGGVRWSVTRLAMTHPIKHLLFATPRHGFAVAGDSLYESTDFGRTWQSKLDPDTTQQVIPVAFFDSLSAVGLDAGKDSAYATRDGGRTWSRVTNFSPWEITDRSRGDIAAVSFRYDSVSRDTVGWLVTDRGLWSYSSGRWDHDSTNRALASVSRVTPRLGFALDTLGNLLRTGDGGRSWSTVLIQPRRYPAPWYYPFLALCIGLAVLSASNRKAVGPRKPTVADLLVSDRPLRESDRDVLDFKSIAGGMSRFLRNPRTEPPLTIAVVGKWGTGKSSLMLMLQRDLDRHRFRTVWFNAWHHQREESLLASLLESIRQRTVPPVWNFRGLRFRSRLLAERYRRYRAPLVFFLPVLALAVGWILASRQQRLADLRSVFADLVNLVTGGTDKEPKAIAPRGTVLAVAVSLVGAVWTYAKGLKAFGVNPAVLAKSVASVSKMRTLELQTGFRYRFAQDFREVTNALKPERLVLFIDDLDRCKPEQVLEILEAVNFLIESGDCVVVLGIDRDRVIGCVGIGFKDVASILAESAPAPEPEDAGAGPRQERPALHLAREEDAAGLDEDIEPPKPQSVPPKRSQEQIQADYARQYLEKLINMEIAIPVANAKNLGDVMTGSIEDDVPKPKPKVPIRTRVLAYRRPLQTVVVAAIVFVAFMLGFRGLDWRPWSRERPAAAMPAPALATVDSGATKELLGGELGVRVRPQAGDDAVILRRTPVAMLPGVPTDRTSWPLWLGLTLVLIVMIWLLIPSEPHQVHDSEKFSLALRSWSPVLYSSLTTPRSAKKFLNRVRYLAMLQRDPPPARSQVDRALGWLGEQASWIDRILRRFGRYPDSETSQAPDKIPENVIVALSVVRETRPAWLARKDFWKSRLASFVNSAQEPIPDKLREALDRVDDLGPLEPYRQDWSKISAGVRTG